LDLVPHQWPLVPAATGVRWRICDKRCGRN
jgi:hypothetical protein